MLYTALEIKEPCQEIWDMSKHHLNFGVPLKGDGLCWGSKRRYGAKGYYTQKQRIRA